jgi:replicative DNA helicase
MSSTLRQSALKELQLTGTEMERWEEMAERAEQAPNDIIVVDVDFATPEKIYADTARWNPDVVIVDYVQLMLAPKHLRASWEKIDYCSRMLKAQARAMKIPVYGIAQSNVDAAEEGAKLTNIGGSRSIGFHSDLVLGMEQRQEDLAQNLMKINIEKNRSGPKNKTIYMKWDQSNSEFRQWNKKLDEFHRAEAV